MKNQSVHVIFPKASELDGARLDTHCVQDIAHFGFSRDKFFTFALMGSSGRP